jgi:hypothetical protein
MFSKMRYRRNEYPPENFKDKTNIHQPIKVVSQPFPNNYELLLLYGIFRFYLYNNF